MGVLLLGGAATIAGVVLFVIAMVLLANRRVRRAYRFPVLPPEGPYAPDRPLLAPRPPPGVYPGYANYGQWPAGSPYAASHPGPSPVPYGSYPPATPQPQPFPAYGSPYGAPAGQTLYGSPPSPPQGWGYPGPGPAAAYGVPAGHWPKLA